MDLSNHGSRRRTAVDHHSIFAFLVVKQYPDKVVDNNQKRNFGLQCRLYSFHDNKLYDKSIKETIHVKVVMDDAKIYNIIHVANEGTGDSSKAMCLSSHRGTNSNMSVLNKRFCFKNILS